MATYTSHLDITYNTGLISQYDENWRAVTETTLRLNDTGIVRLSSVTWNQVGMSDKWKFNITLVDGRQFETKNTGFPVTGGTLHSVNTQNDYFTDPMYQGILAMRLAFFKVIIEHNVQEITWTFT